MLNGRVGWDSKLTKTISNMSQSPDKSSTIIAHDSMTNMSPSIVCLACPGCNACITSSHPAIQLVDLDRRIKCEPCGKYNKAKDWTCKCHVPWHLCSVHRLCHSMCSTKNLPKSGPLCRGSKRIPTMTIEDLRALDNRRTRRGPPAILPPQTNILSPGLREKFAHLLRR